MAAIYMRIWHADAECIADDDHKLEIDIESSLRWQL